MLEFPVISNANNSQVYNLMIINNCAYAISLKTLIDTGASITTWVKGVQSFQAVFPDAKKMDDTEALIRGFGGSGEVADVYIIPEFVLRDEADKTVIFHNLPVIVVKRDYSFNMILSYTLLNKMNFNHIAYSDENSQYNAVHPSINIQPYKGDYYVGFTRRKVSEFRKEIQKYFHLTYCLENTYIFTQGE